jgi:hypothetical protein
MVALLAVGVALIARYLPRYLQRVSSAQHAQPQGSSAETGVKMPGKWGVSDFVCCGSICILMMLWDMCRVFW